MQDFTNILLTGIKNKLTSIHELVSQHTKFKNTIEERDLFIENRLLSVLSNMLTTTFVDRKKNEKFIFDLIQGLRTNQIVYIQQQNIFEENKLYKCVPDFTNDMLPKITDTIAINGFLMQGTVNLCSDKDMPLEMFDNVYTELVKFMVENTKDVERMYNVKGSTIISFIGNLHTIQEFKAAIDYCFATMTDVFHEAKNIITNKETVTLYIFSALMKDLRKEYPVLDTYTDERLSFHSAFVYTLMRNSYRAQIEQYLNSIVNSDSRAINVLIILEYIDLARLLLTLFEDITLNNFLSQNKSEK